MEIILRDFLSLYHWQTWVLVLIMFVALFAMSKVIKKFRLKFQYRVFLGLGLGIVFGIIVAAWMGFPTNDVYSSTVAVGGDKFTNPDYWTTGSLQWAYHVDRWLGMFQNLFIRGLQIMVMPVIFLSIARVVADPTKSGLKGVTLKGIAILLTGVGIAFTITFILGQLFNIGSGFTIDVEGEPSTDPMQPITSVIYGYMPNNFAAVFTGSTVILAIVLGFLTGTAIRLSSKRHGEAMASARAGMDRAWTIVISVLMYIIKYMPFAVFAMIARAFIRRPISEFSSIGGIIGLGYLALAIMYGIQVFLVWLSGVKPVSYMKGTQRAVVSGFLTQSSLATLPLAMTVLKEDLGLGEEANGPNVIMPLSTTMGLAGCAGVQAAVILTVLVNATNSPVTMSLFVFWFLGLIATVIASLGIAGVPGTATIVTIGVMATMGYPAYTNGIIGIISPLNGIFDMGRTAINVSGGLAASVIASQLEGEVPEGLQNKSSPLGPFARKIGAKALAKRQGTTVSKPKEVVEVKEVTETPVEVKPAE